MKKNFFKSKAFKIAAISVLCVGILTGGGIYLAKRNRTSKAVDVYSVFNISQQNWEQFGTYGSVLPGSSETYRKSSAVVKEVYVELGDIVEEGTPLFAYDTTSVEIAKNRAYTAWQLALLDVEDAKKQLEIYKTYTPFTPIEPNVADTADVVDEKYVQEVLLVSKDPVMDGSKDHPFIINCTLDTVIAPSFWKYIKPVTEMQDKEVPDPESGTPILDPETGEPVIDPETGKEKIDPETIKTKIIKEEVLVTPGKYVIIYIWNHNFEADSVRMVKWDINWENDPIGQTAKEYSSDQYSSLYDEGALNASLQLITGFALSPDGTIIIPEKIEEKLRFAAKPEIINPNGYLEPPEIPESKSYSQKEIDQMIADQTRKITTLDISARQAELDYKKAKASAVDGVVKSTCPGVVSTLNDYDTLEANGVFLTVQSNAGLIVQGTIDELDLNVVQPGVHVIVMDMRTGMSYDAVVKEVSSVPQRYGDMMQSVNPNSSFYSFTAEITDPTAELEVYNYVQLMFESTTDSTSFYIPVQFIRKENGSSYVMMMDENGLLKKQFVKTGATLYGSLVEIKGGLTEDDYIAFPYGKTVNEGAKCNTEADLSNLYNY